VLGSEKCRLEKEVFALDKRRNTARKQLDCVSKRIEKLQEETQVQRKAKAAGGTPAKPLKRMAISY
jgi:predicted  nucleic acid-binding Zn-ribbon protein